MKDLSIEILGQELVLSCAGAAYVPAEKTLLVSDLHVGKGATFRAAGIPIPAGSTLATLTSLSDIARRFDAKRVIVLGDLWHAQTSKVLESWLLSEPAEICLVPGNHDRRALKSTVPASLCVWEESATLGPFTLTHHPHPTANFTISGHIHPVCTIEQRRARTRRIRCYWHSTTHLILPSFGDFTGGAPIDRQPDDRVYLCLEDQVFELPH